MECIKSKRIKSNTFELFNYLKSNPKEKLTLEQMEYIVDQTVQIHKQMNKKLVIPIDSLEEII
jgi:hypothetical protein